MAARQSTQNPVATWNAQTKTNVEVGSMALNGAGPVGMRMANQIMPEDVKKRLALHPRQRSTC